eukprot:gene16796-18491_t
MEETFIKIWSDGNNYYLMVSYPVDGPLKLQITLLDGIEAWYGEVFQEELEKQAEGIEKTFSEYWSCTKRALSCVDNDGKTSDFCYNVKFNDNNHAEFQLGSIKLCRNEQRNLGSFLDVAMDQFRKMKTEISSLQANNEKLQKDREESLKKLEDYVTIKNNLEKDLYQKFLLVLNKKKMKIRELKRKKMDEKTIIPLREDTSNEEEETTDEERKEDTSVDKRKKSMPLILDDDGGDDFNDQPPALKRKSKSRRKRGAPSPVFPRTASLPRPAEQLSTGPRRTRSSQKISPSQNSDLERLYDEL